MSPGEIANIEIRCRRCKLRWWQRESDQAPCSRCGSDDLERTGRRLSPARRAAGASREGDEE